MNIGKWNGGGFPDVTGMGLVVRVLIMIASGVSHARSHQSHNKQHTFTIYLQRNMLLKHGIHYMNANAELIKGMKLNLCAPHTAQL